MRAIVALAAFLFSTAAFAGHVQYFEWRDGGGYDGHRQPFSHAVLFPPEKSPARPAEVHILVKNKTESVCILTAKTLQESGLSIGEFLNLLNSSNRINLSCATSGPKERYAKIISLSVDTEDYANDNKTW